MVSHAATGAAPADGRGPQWCGSVLARLSDAGAGLGYRISADPSGFTGSRGREQLQAVCSEGHVTIELAEEAGTVSVHLARDDGPAFALEIVGHYPAVGSVSQTAIVDGITADTLNGYLSFAADTPDGWALVAFDLAGEVVSEGGHAAVVNDQLEPVLATSSTWKDAHALILAFAMIAVERPESAAPGQPSPSCPG